MSLKQLTRDAVLRVGEVVGVDGRKILIEVDRNKNLTDMFLDGDLLRNISVNSFVEIRKGFMSLIGRVEGEHVDAKLVAKMAGEPITNSYKRLLTVSLVGFLNESGRFTSGAKELPLVGNEAFVLTPAKIQLVHNLTYNPDLTVTIATVFGDDFDIAFPVDGLFNSHIAIFGNTGSGKSNTLAILYQELFKSLSARNAEAFRQNAKFVFFDFNGEFARQDCLSPNKRVFNLSTRANDGDRIPIAESELFDIEVVSILSDATDKTQKPFLRRALRLMQQMNADELQNPNNYLRRILKNKAASTLSMSDKVRAYLILDYLREIVPAPAEEDGTEGDIAADIEWHNISSGFKSKFGANRFFSSMPNLVDETVLVGQINQMTLPESRVDRLILCLYIQLINDLLSNRAQNEHVAPVINRLKSRREDIDRIFSVQVNPDFWARNVVVVNLSEVNLEMRKTIPLLLSKYLYTQQKRAPETQSLNIIIDEAHNILSRQSSRETEGWKDYRIETFEEIVKEGRKFGVFLTISSQRPNDISPTISSQAHNYFIHRLINQMDLQTIASAVSYIDRVSEESIPALPTGICIFSGFASQMPLKIAIKQLPENQRPKSATRQFEDIVPESEPQF